MGERDEIIISLSDIWNIIKRNAAFIIVVTLICAIGSFFYNKIFYPKVIYIINSVICRYVK